MEEFLRDSPHEGQDLQLNVQEFSPNDLGALYQDPFFEFDQTGAPGSDGFNEFDAQANTLDELISPNNLYQTVSPMNQNPGFGHPLQQTISPTYFSPPTNNRVPQMGGRGYNGPQLGLGLLATPQYNPLNLISEDQLFSPNSAYLSPQAYVLPNIDQLDTLRLPTFTLPIRMSTSVSTQDPILSPPPANMLSLLVPLLLALALRDTRLLSKEEKLKRRREFHNAVERRRRDLIKEKIKELGVIVPPLMLNPQLCAVQLLLLSSNPEVSDLISLVKVKETKPNKATILNKLVDYIQHLKYVLEQQDRERERLQQKLNSLQLGQDYNQFNQDDFFNEVVLSQFSDAGDYGKFF